MALTSFTYFPLLPAELRREIYLLATPPRVVHVREEAELDYKTFARRLRRDVVQLKVHPSALHFISSWRRHVPRRTQQTTLEQHGFTNSRALYQPWEPSAEAPAVPSPWLSEHPELAWELARNCHLYSSAPIPQFLHVCSESRATLMRDGYELTFRSRTSGPRTWFNHSRDVLFVAYNSISSRDVSACLTGEHWDFAQFAPEDMAKVRRLALGSGTWALPGPFIRPEFGCSMYTPICRLFGNLKELLLVEWTQDTMKELTNLPTGSSRLWNVVDIEEADALLHVIGKWGPWPGYQVCTGPLVLAARNRNDGQYSSYFEHLRAIVQEEMVKLRRLEAIETNQDPSSLWQVPRSSFVHILPPRSIEHLAASRQSAIARLSYLRGEWESIQRAARLAPGDPRQDIFRRRVFEKTHWPNLDHDCNYEECYGCEESLSKPKKRYIEGVAVPPPQTPIILTL